MRLLSIDGWDVPCAPPAKGVKSTRDPLPSSTLKTCIRMVDEFGNKNAAVHVLEVANPTHVVNEKNR